ncbi:TadE/TadG family type IV pilus assembly protein [Vibrio neonatus]|uniref:TadE/TadG family type IV pilus assembly protein n=1 Tax=Vibrio neonatus TaxID=278860 RepID=UPI0021C48287|nr:TadE family protein [Vibrio neonatus]
MNKRLSHRKNLGLASVEMTFIVPILLIIMMGVFELTQVIQANNIIISISREGANLISRNSSQTPEQVMDTIASTSDPLDLNQDGIIYINLVVGREDNNGNPLDPVLNQQYRWGDFGYTASSSTWSGCTQWTGDDNGICDMDSDPVLTNFPLQLDSGESVYVVEVMYRYSPISTLIFDSDFTIKEITYL